MFRAAIGARTELGRKVEPILASGALVPDDITVALIKERLAAPDALPGFILDGFPRNEAQAVALDEMLDDKRVRGNLHRALMYRACGNVFFEGKCSDKKGLWVQAAEGRAQGLIPDVRPSYHVRELKPSM